VSPFERQDPFERTMSSKKFKLFLKWTKSDFQIEVPEMHLPVWFLWFGCKMPRSSDEIVNNRNLNNRNTYFNVNNRNTYFNWRVQVWASFRKTSQGPFPAHTFWIIRWRLRNWITIQTPTIRTSRRHLTRSPDTVTWHGQFPQSDHLIKIDSLF
jgi:hypothetical protein